MLKKSPNGLKDDRAHSIKGLDKYPKLIYTENVKDYTKYSIVKCPMCGENHRLPTWMTKVARFTRLCHVCNGKVQGKIVGKISLRGEKSPRWRGGRYKNRNGYIVYTLQPHEDFFQPMAGGGTNRLMEHRLVMAKYLNRCLLPWEVVHHKNGIKDDNRIENLELLPDKRWHLIDNKTKSYIAILRQQIDRLQEKIEQLEGKNETTAGN